LHAPAEKHAGHGHSVHGDHVPQFRRLFWVNLVLTIPVVLLSPMFAHLLGYDLPDISGLQFVSPVLGTVVYLYGGRPFLTGAWDELRSRQPGMMLLIAMAITVAFVSSWAATARLLGASLDFWWELALLVTIMLLGHWLEMRALMSATGALDALAALLPDQAEIVVAGDVVQKVPTAHLAAGDVVLVRPGGRVPADGRIVSGEAELDESMITGESRPVLRSAADRVVAGTVVTDSAIRVQVTAVGSDTTLAGIQRLIAQAQASRSHAQALADRAAAALFYFAAIAGVLSLIVWASLGDLASAIERTVTVLVIACPHALGLAIPLVIAISTELAAKQGILVRNRLALERMRSVDIVLFDKTGTLTKGEPSVTGVAGLQDGAEARTSLLRLAGAAESASEHPAARAIVRAAANGHPLPSASDFRSLPGRGVTATVNGSHIAVGGPALLHEIEAAVPASVGQAARGWAVRGAGVLYVVRDKQVIGALSIEDQLRPESRQAIEALHRDGVKVAMITGDARQVAESVAQELGVDEVLAEVLPQDKDGEVARIQARGLRVAMVGDGVNDAPALARADVGIAIGAGTDVAIESAGVILASNDPRGVLAIRRLSEAGYRKMWQNLVWAAGYNLGAVPLAGGVLAWAGFVLPMEAGAILMSLSTVVVALNAQLLRRLDLRPASS
jgi:Cu2+-exporting ATPase